MIEAVIIVAVPVSLSFCLGWVGHKLREDRVPTIKIPIATLVRKDKEDTIRIGITSTAQLLGWRGGLATLIHAHFPLTKEALNRIVLRTEKNVIAELRKAGFKIEYNPNGSPKQRET
jgi:hypothetical protein